MVTACDARHSCAGPYIVLLGVLAAGAAAAASADAPKPETGPDFTPTSPAQTECGNGLCELPEEDPCNCPEDCGVELVTMGTIADECGEGGEEFCLFRALLEAETLTITNDFTVEVSELLPITDHVYFRVECPAGVTCPDPFEAGIDETPEGNVYEFVSQVMDRLPADGMYRITASAHIAHPGISEEEAEQQSCMVLDSTSEDFAVLPPPAWYQLSVVDGGNHVGQVDEQPYVEWDSGDREYTFRGRIPHSPEHGPYFVEQSVDIPLLGDTNNACGIRVDVEEIYDLYGAVEQSGEGGLKAVILDITLVEEPFDVVVQSGDYHIDYESPVLLEHSETIFEGTIFRGTVDGVDFAVKLTIESGWEVSADLCGVADETLQFTPACLAPDLDFWTHFIAGLDLWGGVASLKLNGRPTIEYLFPFCYDYTETEQYYVTWQVEFDMQVWGTVCVAFDLACWDSPRWRPDGLPLTESGGGGDDCFDKAGADSTPSREASNSGPMASPRIASDGLGNALAVWIHDDNAGSNPPNPDVYYSYKPAAGFWSAPAPVASTNLFETDPRITFISPEHALLVVTQSQLDQAGAAAQNGVLKNILREQELVCYEFFGPSTWQPKGLIHADTGLPLADGRAELTEGPHAFPVLVWVRDPDQELGDGPYRCVGGPVAGDPCVVNTDCFGGICAQEPRCNSDVVASRWTGTNWSPFTTIGGQGTDGCCAEVDVAIDQQNRAMAVWVRDEDGDPNTGGDRVVETAYFNGTIWEAPFTAVDTSGDLYGLLWPSIAFDDLDRPAIAFTSRGAPDEDAPPAYEYGEGIHDYLFVARRAVGSAANLPTPFEEIQPVGCPYQTRARWPRLTMAAGPSGPLAVIAYRSFTGLGSAGYDGEIGLAAAPVNAGFAGVPFWKATMLTDDYDLDWQIDVDPTGAIVRIIWIEPSTAHQDPAIPFGFGYDGIQMIELSMPEIPILGDGNADGIVNRTDYAMFAGCMAGPGIPPLGGEGPCPATFDGDCDGDLDLKDLSTMQIAFTTP